MSEFKPQVIPAVTPMWAVLCREGRDAVMVEPVLAWEVVEDWSTNREVGEHPAPVMYPIVLMGDVARSVYETVWAWTVWPTEKQARAERRKMTGRVVEVD